MKNKDNGEYMNYILDYDKVLDILNNMKNLTKMKSIDTRLGYEVPYYTYGNGEKHIVIVGGTHGSEIISVDFVLKLMNKIANKKDVFKNLDENKFTFHFIPLQNPEGFIISTSVIKTIINDNMSLEEIEKICKEYYLNYRQDDINSKKSNIQDVKLHQQMFENVTYKCIPKKYKKIRESIKEMYKDKRLPKGSLICFRANSSGIELNRNVRFNKGIRDIKEQKSVYGLNRYNNIPTTIKGPLGIPCIDVDNFSYENENILLFNILDKLFNEKKYCGCLLFHSTGGEIYHKPIFESYENNYDDKLKEKISNRNLHLALEYQKHTGYNLTDNNDKEFNSFDGYLRTLYPNILLIELSKMGGNPIGPYGDIKNNYIPTIENNLKATRNVIELMINKTGI